jgi:hypothetical protein
VRDGRDAIYDLTIFHIPSIAAVALKIVNPTGGGGAANDEAPWCSAGDRSGIGDCA